MEGNYRPDIPGVPEQKPTGSVSPIRTYRSDVASEIRQKNISGLDIALAEQRKNRANGTVVTPETSNTALYGAIAIVLLLFVVGVGGYFFFVHSNEPVTQTGQIAPESILFADSKTTTDLSGIKNHTELVSAVQKAITSSTSGPNTLSSVSFSLKNPAGERILTASEFIEAAAPHVPGALTRATEGPFMTGTYNATQKSPYLLLRVDSYQSAYGAMLEWENALNADMLPLFGKSLPNKNEPLIWKDDMLRNTSLRREQGGDGKDILLYSFLDDHTLLITTSDVVFYELLARLHTPRPANTL